MGRSLREGCFSVSCMYHCGFVGSRNEFRGGLSQPVSVSFGYIC
jgi:hypothetical protein